MLKEIVHICAKDNTFALQCNSNIYTIFAFDIF